jgi:hypothetical protein
MFDASEFVSLPNGVPRGGLGLADVDQDGDTDVAIAQLWQAFRRTSLIVLENDGTGDLTQSLSIDTGREVSEIFAGDVNSDDRLDIVFSPAGGAIPTSSAIGVIYGNEQGGFDPFEEIPLGNTDRLIAMLDIDDDGEPDLITGHSESAAGTFGPEVTARGLEVFTSDGAGGFSLHGVYPGPRTPSDLAVGDLDQDGDDDLLSFSAGIADMLSSNGDGTFDGWESNLAADDPPRAVAVGDLDADGDLDLVSTAGAQYQQGTVSVRLGQGNGQFGPPDVTNISDGTVTPGAVVTGDIDGDGDLDVVTANRFAGLYGGGSDGAVSVLLGNGSGGLAAPIDIVIGSDPAALALGDIDGDGDLDIVATTRRSYGGGANAVVVLTNIGAAQFAEPLVLGLSAFPAGLALGDVDNDDDLDIVTANGHADLSTSLFRNRGNGQFDPPEVPISGASTDTIALADLDGDDDLDLLVSNSSEQIAVALGGGATSGFAPAELYPIGLSARAMSVADLDRDGHLDVALITGNGLVVVAAGLGDGTLGAVGGFSVGLDPVSLALGDLDNDSDLDLVTANLVSGGFSVRLNSTMLSSGFSPVPAPSAPVRSVIAIAEGTPEGSFNDHPVVRKLTASRIDRAIVEWPDAHTSSNSASDRLLASRQRPHSRQRARDGIGDLHGAGVDSP